jgi:hypothetical protein
MSAGNERTRYVSDRDNVKRIATKVFERAGLGRPLLEFAVGAQQLTLTEVSEGSLALDLEVFQTPLGETGKLRLHLTQEAVAKLGDLLSSGQHCTRDDLESGVDA